MTWNKSKEKSSDNSHLLRKVIKTLSLHHHQRGDRNMCIKLIETFPDAVYRRTFLEHWGYYDHLLQLDIKDGKFLNIAESMEQKNKFIQAAGYYLKAGEARKSSDLILLRGRAELFPFVFGKHDPSPELKGCLESVIESQIDPVSISQAKFIKALMWEPDAEPKLPENRPEWVLLYCCSQIKRKLAQVSLDRWNEKMEPLIRHYISSLCSIHRSLTEMMHYGLQNKTLQTLLALRPSDGNKRFGTR